MNKYPFIVAEIGANHLQNKERALALVAAAKDAGADAVKLQTFQPETMVARRTVGGAPVRMKEGPWAGEELWALYERSALPWSWHEEIFRYGAELGIPVFSTPFDSTAIDFLERLDCPMYKIASFEILDLALIAKAAATGKQLVISTGMATVEEIDEAVHAARGAGATQIALLKCTSAYPASPDDMNLRTIQELARRFDVPVGLSDHTMGIAVPVAAVALGACIIEKHLTLSRALPGPDSAFSLEPQEFKAMVDAVRIAERALGKVHFGASPLELKSRIFRRSLFVVQDLKQGQPFSDHNVHSIRPGHGLHTRHLREVLGKHATRDIERGTPLSWDLVAK